MTFVPSLRPQPGNGDTPLWFLFQENRLLVHQHADHALIPSALYPADLGICATGPIFLGLLNHRPCFAARLKDEPVSGSWILKSLRGLFSALDEDLFWVAGLGYQLLDWAHTHRFCGRCGTATTDKTDERGKLCPACRLVNYPRVSPAIIVAIVRGQSILLARSPRFRAGMFSVLAGFVEPGETLEDCVRREVGEEVGIQVSDIRYFGSQPWPFPNSLMIGFTANYAGGEIVMAPGEIVDAGWYRADNLPPVPDKISMARKLIDWFVATRQSTPVGR
jgi:NAD+ diphosphatase